MTHYFSQYILLFKALADETRLQIVHMLTLESMHANSILECFSLSQPTLSYHMKILTGCGLVKARREGGYTIYSVNAQRLIMARDLMQTFLEGTQIVRQQEEN